MSLQVEMLEHNMAKLTIEVSAEEFEKAMQNAYLKNRGRINVQGFRKGKAPRALIEKMYGPSIFFEEAANSLIPTAYDKEVSACDLEIVSRPEIDVVQIEKGKPFIFTAEVAVKPEVTLGEYKGVSVPKANTEVTEEDINKEIEKEREKNSRTINIEDRPVADGDAIKLDFDGSVDGVPFEGGKADNYDLVVGSGSFIPGFEEQLIGVEIGQPVDVKVTFPEDYSAKNLAGKEAVFACKVNAITKKELPEVDDDFAADVSEFDTLAEYKEDIAKKLQTQKEATAKRARELAAVNAAVANAEMDIPAAMIDNQARQMVDEFAQRVQQQGLTMEQYMQFTGMTVDKILEQMKPEAETRIKNSLVLEAIALKEDFEVADERIEEEINKMADVYKMEADKVKAALGEAGLAQMKADLKIQAAVDFVRDNAVEAE